jgi:hypothetical protein
MTALITNLPAEFQAAQVDYKAIAPMLVVFGGAIIGVLIEAFAPRTMRYAAQVTVAIASLVAALVVLVTVSVDAQGITLERAVVIDGPALFLQGAILLMSDLGVLTMAERFGGEGADAFTPAGAAVPGPLAYAAVVDGAAGRQGQEEGGEEEDDRRAPGSRGGERRPSVHRWLSPEVVRPGCLGVFRL